jgi:hypothetical protein
MSSKKRKSAGTQVAKIDPVSVAADGSLQINLQEVAAPKKTYDADFAWPQVRLGVVSVFFGKCDLNEDRRLRTRLELRYPLESFVAHFWNNSRTFHAGLRRSCENLPGWQERGTIKPETWSADADHSEWVNFDYVARTGSQGVLDFFYLSPQAVVRFKRGQGTKDLTLQPVVRVNTTTLEILNLLDSSEAIANQYEPIHEAIGSEQVDKG